MISFVMPPHTIYRLAMSMRFLCKESACNGFTAMYCRPNSNGDADMTTTLTKTEAFILNEVDSCPDKTASASLVRRSVNLSIVGFRRVVDRMVSKRFLGLTSSGDLALTFAGMQALQAAGWEVSA
jgi:hypothetical protein